jgi:nicotinamidase-related amidase
VQTAASVGSSQENHLCSPTVGLELRPIAGFTTVQQHDGMVKHMDRPPPVAEYLKDCGLRHGPLGPGCLHLCVDMQVMFAQPTEWHVPWMSRVLPNVVALVGAHPERTIFTRFIPAPAAGEGVGTWRRYYTRWATMTLSRLPPDMIDLVPDLAAFVPPARLLDKPVYSPWLGSTLHAELRTAGVDTLIISGAETDVCVLATALGAIDFGFRVVLAMDALCSSTDETHDALLRFYRARFGEQIETANVEKILEHWR